MDDARSERRRHTRVVLAVTVIALAATLVMAAPVLVAPSDRIFGMEIVGRHHDPFTVMQQMAGDPIPPPYLQPATDWTGRALAQVMTPVAAYNVLVLWTFPLAAMFGCLFAYELTRSPATSAVAGLLFAFAPFHVAHAAYHVHITQVQWIPLYFFALWRCLHGTTPARAATLVAALGLLTLSNYYGGLIALAMTPPTLLLFWLAPSPDGRTRSWRDLAWTSALLVTLGATALLTVWWIAPTVFDAVRAQAFPRDDLFLFSARWWSYLVPPVAHPALGAWSRRVWDSYGAGTGLLEQQVFLGIGVVTLAAVAIGARVYGRGRPIAPAVPWLAAIAAVALICSLSPERQVFGVRVVRPSALLYLVAPMFRSYARFGVVVQLMTAIVAAAGATWLWQRRTRVARVAVVALVVLTAFEYTPLPWRWRDVLPTSAHRWLARNSTAPRVFDCTELTVPEQATAWLSGYAIGYPIAGVPDCGEPDLAGQLCARGFTDVIVKADRPEFRSLTEHGRAGLRLVHPAEDAIVFAVTNVQPAAFVTAAQGLFPREYDQARTWRWTSGHATLLVERAGTAWSPGSLDIELASFAIDRHVAVSLNGEPVATLLVRSSRATYRIGPLRLVPGPNRLLLSAAEPPVVAGTLERNNDTRPLSIAIGLWRWQQP